MKDEGAKLSLFTYLHLFTSIITKSSYAKSITEETLEVYICTAVNSEDYDMGCKGPPESTFYVSIF